MNGGSMAWWYWFGMWVFGIAGLVIVWWMVLDAWRRSGAATRFSWPIAATAGLLLQLPAFAIGESQRAGSQGAVAGTAGVAGFVLVGIAAVAYFSKSSGGSGSTWSLRTRDSGSASSAARDRRVPQRPARASVPISGSDAMKSTTPPIPPSPAAATAPVIAAGGAPPPAVTPGAPSRTVRGGSAATSPLVTDGEMTEVAEDAAAETHNADQHPDPTLADSVDQTLTDDVDSTISEDLSATITEEMDHTLVEEAEGLDPGATGAELVITDGRTSRIIVSEQTGPFLVGRDPSRCSMAIDDGRASRTHFSIQLVDGEYIIEDLGSSNGTFLNGAMLRESSPLEDGDMIEFGRTVATFRHHGKETT